MTDVLRWLVDIYRSRLREVDPEACRYVDYLAAAAGQGWVSDSTVVDLDEVLTAKEIEQRHGVREFAVRARARRRGVRPRGKRAGANLYRLGDILAPLK